MHSFKISDTLGDTPMPYIELLDDHLIFNDLDTVFTQMGFQLQKGPQNFGDEEFLLLYESSQGELMYSRDWTGSHDIMSKSDGLILNIAKALVESGKFQQMTD